jgi:DNA modification methylase
MFETEKGNIIITVLGKTFNSVEDRREYFRKELRKHLPELKKMEGFPIGEDDDIINLSDPPFYTACPNPWLNDFIGEWEEEKKQLEKDGKRNASFKVDEPYAADVSEGKNNPVYKAHSYVTKVPHPAIMRYIMHYTQPGDLVFDGFAGTGMTGVAASFCRSQKSVSELGIYEEETKLGARNAIMSDLSPLANYISYSFNNKPQDLNLFLDRFEKITEELTSKFKHLYTVEHDSNKELGYLDYTIWSDVFRCNNCENEIVYWEGAVDHNASLVKNEVDCINCGSSVNKNKLERIYETIFDSELNLTRKKAKRIPVLCKYSYGGKTHLKEIKQRDLDFINKTEMSQIKNWIPTFGLPIGYNTAQPKRSHGYNYVHDFYSKRNLIVLSELVKCLKTDELVFLTSLINRSTNLNATVMSNYFKQLKGNTAGGWAGKPREGTLYMPSISTEVNVLKSLKSRLRSIVKMKSFIQGNNSNILINSFDYIFVDPPFGANRMYSELNFISESWLKVRTNNSKEAIENKVQGKSSFDYLNLMQSCFNEFYRVLKPGKWMTVEFSNTSAAIWNGIQSTLQLSGFVIANISALDKKQGSVKAVTTPTAVKQDLIISCYKPSSEFDEKFKQHQNSNVGVWDFVDEHLNHLPIHLLKQSATTAIIERSPKILFDRLIAFYIQKGLPVPIDAGKFQQGLRKRFIERDGMFFTNEQVQEYDKKKAENPEFVQLSILVSSEQDGVLWLKNLLTDKSLTYQDIQPLWMQALAGVRKGDVIPELADILEENFLKDEEGKWYTPDPVNEADLGKLRTKRLLKQFDTYKTEAAKPKAKKIKEVRVEALRAGFKQCYQDKDFSSIVSVGDKIPNNLLMEDEVLLQFYDIASTRV